MSSMRGPSLMILVINKSTYFSEKFTLLRNHYDTWYSNNNHNLHLLRTYYVLVLSFMYSSYICAQVI